MPVRPSLVRCPLPSQLPPLTRASAGELETPLSEAIVDGIFSTSRISSLYAHQARAIDLLAAGHSVIVSTSTSSGKSLIYQLPMLQALESDPDSTGLYIFPTKALAQDQKRALGALLAATEGMGDARASASRSGAQHH